MIDESPIKSDASINFDDEPALVDKAVEMLKSEDEESELETARTGTASRKRPAKKIIPMDIFPPAKTSKLPNFKKKADKLKAKSTKKSSGKTDDKEPARKAPVWEKKPPRSKSFLVSIG